MREKEGPRGPMFIDREYINDDNLKFISFYARSRLYADYNLKLAYLLIQCKNCSLADAAEVLKISRTLFYTRIFPDNAAFLSKKVPVTGWGHGGQERRIKMSDEMIRFAGMIQEYAEYHLGDRECQRLKSEANKILKNAPRGKSGEEQLHMTLKILRRIIKTKPWDYQKRLRDHARLRQIDPKKLDKMVRC